MSLCHDRYKQQVPHSLPVPPEWEIIAPINIGYTAGIETTKIATVYTLIIGLIFILIPRIVLSLITNDQVVIETAIPILHIAGFAQIFYATGIVLANSLQAAGKTLFVMISEVFTNWVLFIPLSYFLGVYLNYGLVGAWTALPLYIIAYAATIYIKFRWGNWQIEKS